MDYYIRWGLLLAWLLFGLALLIWWRRRHASRRYPYSERAAVILQALEQGADIGMIYWSKTARRHLRRVVTPQSLDGYAMRAFDPKAAEVRIYKVTRIRWLELIPRGAPRRAPSIWKLVTPAMAGAVAVGLLAFGLLALALTRSQGPQRLSGVVPPPVEPPADLTSTVVAARSVGAVVATASATVAESAIRLSGMTPVMGVNTDDFLNVPAPEVTKPIRLWRVVVLKHPDYKITQVAAALSAAIRCAPNRCVELEQAVNQIGEAVVWTGPRERAEKIKRLLEGYHLTVRVESPDEPAEPAGSGATNEPAATPPPA